MSNGLSIGFQSAGGDRAGMKQDLQGCKTWKGRRLAEIFEINPPVPAIYSSPITSHPSQAPPPASERNGPPSPDRSTA